MNVINLLIDYLASLALLSRGSGQMREDWCCLGAEAGAWTPASGPGLRRPPHTSGDLRPRLSTFSIARICSPRPTLRKIERRVRPLRYYCPVSLLFDLPVHSALFSVISVQSAFIQCLFKINILRDQVHLFCFMFPANVVFSFAHTPIAAPAVAVYCLLSTVCVLPFIISNIRFHFRYLLGPG